jgi:uncharacterized protein (TIGR03067 family)
MTAEEQKEGNLTPQPPSLEGKGEPVLPPPEGEVKDQTPPSLPGKGVGGLGSSLRPRRMALVLAVAAIAFGIWYFAIRTPEPRDDFGRFQGEWKIAVPADPSDKHGEKQPAARIVQGVTIRVTHDRWVYLLGGKEQKKYTMVLRPEANPKEIDLTQLAPDDKPLIQKWPPPPRPVMIRGIYTIERDRAKIVSVPGDEPRPTDLDATDGVTVLLLERVK